MRLCICGSGVQDLFYATVQGRSLLRGCPRSSWKWLGGLGVGRRERHESGSQEDWSQDWAGDSELGEVQFGVARDARGDCGGYSRLVKKKKWTETRLR